MFHVKHLQNLQNIGQKIIVQINLNDIKIRLANIDDLPEIINLLIQDELGKNREIIPLKYGEVERCYIESYNKINKDPNHKLIVMEYNGEIIGTLQFIIIPTIVLQGAIRAEVEGVRIKSKYRNLELGKFLFAWVKETAINNNCTIIQLTTNKTRKAAQRFYKSLGFMASHYGMKLILK